MSNSTFTGNLTNIAKTRIMADHNLINNDKQIYDESEIYFHFNENELNNNYIFLIIGSNDIDNPYYGGFFFFEGTFPDQYPFFPPKIEAKTQGENMRFHPNFYTNGKCCLSILGTWSGPPWTSCQNIGTIAHTMKSLYICNPITQEPGWENLGKSKESELYSIIVTYRTLEIAVLRMLENSPKGKNYNFDIFLPIMEKLFLKNYSNYIKKIENLLYLDNKIFSLSLWKLEGKFCIKNLKTNFETKYNILKQKYELPCESLVGLLNKKERKRQSPSEPASNYDIDFIKKSENDNNNWKVISLKNGGKRWKKI